MFCCKSCYSEGAKMFTQKRCFILLCIFCNLLVAIALPICTGGCPERARLKFPRITCTHPLQSKLGWLQGKVCMCSQSPGRSPKIRLCSLPVGVCACFLCSLECYKSMEALGREWMSLHFPFLNIPGLMYMFWQAPVELSISLLALQVYEVLDCCYK